MRAIIPLSPSPPSPLSPPHHPSPPTALCLLTDFVDLRPGDVVIQNAANSAVGQYVIQLASRRGLRTVNLIRDRPAPERAALEASLRDMGADLVVTPGELRAALVKSGLPAPRLALDCAGGEAATAIAKTLEAGGTMVTFGAMSKGALSVPPSLLIFKDIRLRGFWLSGRYAAKGAAAKEGVIDAVATLFQDKVLRPAPVRCFALDAWRDALAHYAEGRTNTKVVFSCDPDDGL